jgi:hypothetical protein
LNIQSTPRRSPRVRLTTKVGPVSRAQASSVVISTTVIDGEEAARARSHWPEDASMVTGSLWATVSATAVKAAWAGPACIRQLSGRSGHTM